MKLIVFSSIASALFLNSATAQVATPCPDSQQPVYAAPSYQPPQPSYAQPAYVPVPPTTYAKKPPAAAYNSAPKPVPQPAYVPPPTTYAKKPPTAYQKPVPEPVYSAPVTEPVYAAQEPVDRTSSKYFKDLQEKKLAEAVGQTNGHAIDEIRDDSDLPKGYNHPTGYVKCYHSLHSKYSKKVKKAAAGALGAVAGGTAGAAAGGAAGFLINPAMVPSMGGVGAVAGAIKGAKVTSHAISFEGNASDCLSLGGRCCSGDILGRSGIALDDELDNEHLQCNHCWGAFNVKE